MSILAWILIIVGQWNALLEQGWTYDPYLMKWIAPPVVQVEREVRRPVR